MLSRRPRWIAFAIGTCASWLAGRSQRIGVHKRRYGARLATGGSFALFCSTITVAAGGCSSGTSASGNSGEGGTISEGVLRGLLAKMAAQPTPAQLRSTAVATRLATAQAAPMPDPRPTAMMVSALTRSVTARRRRTAAAKRRRTVGTRVALPAVPASTNGTRRKRSLPTKFLSMR